MNLVCHYKDGKSDKVYIVGVMELPGGMYQTTFRWGRRGGHVQETATVFSSEVAAKSAARNQFNAKLKKGYVDITGTLYRGGLSMSDPWLVRNLVNPPATARTPAPKQPTSNGTPERNPFVPDEVFVAEEKSIFDAGADDELYCLDATGMTDGFDEGLSYVVERHKDPTLLWVYDRNGVKVEKFRSRFGSKAEYLRKVAGK